MLNTNPILISFSVDRCICQSAFLLTHAFVLQRLLTVLGQIPQVTEKIKHKFHELMLMWHPDKNQYKDQKECHSWTVYIKFGREVLLDPDLKRRYDLELKRQTKEADHWSSAEWYCKWGFNLVAMAGGIALIVSGCLVPAAFLGTAIAGSALLMTGVNGTATMIRDADCSIEEYVTGCLKFAFVFLMFV